MTTPLYDLIWNRYGNAASFLADLNKRLIEHGISRTQLALRAEYHPSHVSNWLNGKVTPELKTLVILDEACDQLIAYVEGR